MINKIWRDGEHDWAIPGGDCFEMAHAQNRIRRRIADISASRQRLFDLVGSHVDDAIADANAHLSQPRPSNTGYIHVMKSLDEVNTVLQLLQETAQEVLGYIHVMKSLDEVNTVLQLLQETAQEVLGAEDEDTEDLEHLEGAVGHSVHHPGYDDAIHDPGGQPPGGQPPDDPFLNQHLTDACGINEKIGGNVEREDAVNFRHQTPVIQPPDVNQNRVPSRSEYNIVSNSYMYTGDSTFTTNSIRRNVPSLLPPTPEKPTDPHTVQRNINDQNIGQGSDNVNQRFQPGPNLRYSQPGTGGEIPNIQPVNYRPAGNTNQGGFGQPGVNMPQQTSDVNQGANFAQPGVNQTRDTAHLDGILSKQTEGATNRVQQTGEFNQNRPNLSQPPQNLTQPGENFNRGDSSTLSQSSYSKSSSTVSTITDDAVAYGAFFLERGKICQVNVVEISNPYYFRVQKVGVDLDKVNQDVKMFVQCAGPLMSYPPSVTPNNPCLVKISTSSSTSQWLRAKISDSPPQSAGSVNGVSVHLVDYGRNLQVALQDTCQIPDHLIHSPIQSGYVALAKVAPPKGTILWSEQATNAIKVLSANVTLQCCALSAGESPVPLVQLHRYEPESSTLSDINHLLVEYNFAQPMSLDKQVQLLWNVIERNGGTAQSTTLSREMSAPLPRSQHDDAQVPSQQTSPAQPAPRVSNIDNQRSSNQQPGNQTNRDVNDQQQRGTQDRSGSMAHKSKERRQDENPSRSSSSARTDRPMSRTGDNNTQSHAGPFLGVKTGSTRDWTGRKYEENYAETDEYDNYRGDERHNTKRTTPRFPTNVINEALSKQVQTEDSQMVRGRDVTESMPQFDTRRSEPFLDSETLQKYRANIVSHGSNIHELGGHPLFRVNDPVSFKDQTQDYYQRSASRAESVQYSTGRERDKPYRRPRSSFARVEPKYGMSDQKRRMFEESGFADRGRSDVPVPYHDDIQQDTSHHGRSKIPIPYHDNTQQDPSHHGRSEMLVQYHDNTQQDPLRNSPFHQEYNRQIPAANHPTLDQSERSNVQHSNRREQEYFGSILNTNAQEFVPLETHDTINFQLNQTQRDSRLTQKTSQNQIQMRPEPEKLDLATLRKTSPDMYTNIPMGTEEQTATDYDKSTSTIQNMHKLGLQGNNRPPLPQRKRNYGDRSVSNTDISQSEQLPHQKSDTFFPALDPRNVHKPHTAPTRNDVLRDSGHPQNLNQFGARKSPPRNDASSDVILSPNGTSYSLSNAPAMSTKTDPPRSTVLSRNQVIPISLSDALTMSTRNDQVPFQPQNIYSHFSSVSQSIQHTSPDSTTPAIPIQTPVTVSAMRAFGRGLRGVRCKRSSPGPVPGRLPAQSIKASGNKITNVEVTTTTSNERYDEHDRNRYNEQRNDNKITNVDVTTTTSNERYDEHDRNRYNEQRNNNKQAVSRREAYDEPKQIDNHEQLVSRIHTYDEPEKQVDGEHDRPVSRRGRYENIEQITDEISERTKSRNDRPWSRTERNENYRPWSRNNQRINEPSKNDATYQYTWPQEPFSGRSSEDSTYVLTDDSTDLSGIPQSTTTSTNPKAPINTIPLDTNSTIDEERYQNIARIREIRAASKITKPIETDTHVSSDTQSNIHTIPVLPYPQNVFNEYERKLPDPNRNSPQTNAQVANIDNAKNVEVRNLRNKSYNELKQRNTGSVNTNTPTNLSETATQNTNVRNEKKKSTSPHQHNNSLEVEEITDSMDNMNAYAIAVQNKMLPKPIAQKSSSIHKINVHTSPIKIALTTSSVTAGQNTTTSGIQSPKPDNASLENRYKADSELESILRPEKLDKLPDIQHKAPESLLPELTDNAQNSNPVSSSATFAASHFDAIITEIAECLARDPIQVILSALVSPGMFYVNCVGDSQIFEQIETDIRSHMNQHRDLRRLSQKLKVRQNERCLGRYDDGLFYRGIITDKNISKASQAKIEVFFLDFGNVEYVARTDLYPMPDLVNDYPCQATLMQLAFVEPNSEADDWSLESIRMMSDMCMKTRNQLLYAYVTPEALPNGEVVGDTPMPVVLIDTGNEQDVCINASLVQNGHARFIAPPKDWLDRDNWDPKAQEFMGERNSYQINTDDPGIATVGIESQEYKVCRYYNTRKGCYRGESCPHKHTKNPSQNNEDSQGVNTFTNMPLPKKEWHVHVQFQFR